MVRVALFLALLAPAAAFVPSISIGSRPVYIALDAMNRRDAMGLAFAGLVAGALPQDASASNPGKFPAWRRGIWKCTLHLHRMVSIALFVTTHQLMLTFVVVGSLITNHLKRFQHWKHSKEGTERLLVINL